jgi:hypothetical protein
MEALRRRTVAEKVWGLVNLSLLLHRAVALGTALLLTRSVWTSWWQSVGAVCLGRCATCDGAVMGLECDVRAVCALHAVCAPSCLLRCGHWQPVRYVCE